MKKPENTGELVPFKKKLKIDNKIEKPFGRTAVFAGVIFFITGGGILIAGFVILGVITVLISALVIFTFSGVEIDTEKRQIRQYNKWVGLVKTGKWKSLDFYIGVTLIPITTWESMASWSNRTTSNKTTDFRIFLVSKNKKPAFAIKKCNTLHEAKNCLDEFSIWLKFPVFSVKK
ncbi:hypothetical protein D1164_19185 [Mariniphaga sediminis]|uniref:Uncharacterized protein n=1 Tax=Mariniphaga sediminis TaxID=1628158 RepID=A0A399CUP8_9BACT|nr:hypothetical protein [Mariniphaga sediminis]RIH63555.1 hypothetical protein D1164_19185 [Mariniphaga sediminis]